MEHEQVQNQYVDRVLAEVEGEVWVDIFFKVEEVRAGETPVVDGFFGLNLLLSLTTTPYI